MDMYETGTGRVQDKPDKTDSNWIRLIDGSPVHSTTSFVHVQKPLMYLLNLNGHGMYTTNVNRIWKMDINVFQRTLFDFNPFQQSGMGAGVAQAVEHSAVKV